MAYEAALDEAERSRVPKKRARRRFCPKRAAAAAADQP
jgi:hypothetical protein